MAIRCTSLALYRTPLPNNQAAANLKAARHAYYLKYRDMLLTCLREESWCAKVIRSNNKRVKNFPAATSALAAAIEQAKKRHGREEALHAAITERMASAKSAAAIKQKQLTSLMKSADGMKAIQYHPMHALLSSSSSSSRSGSIFDDCNSAAVASLATPALRREYFALRRSVGICKRSVASCEVALQKSGDAVSQWDGNVANLTSQLATLVATAGLGIDSRALGNSNSDSTNAEGNTKGAAAKSGAAHKKSRMLSPTAQRKAAESYSALLGAQTNAFRQYALRVRASQLPFREQYRQLVFEERFAEAENLLLRKYTSIMRARGEEDSTSVALMKGGRGGGFGGSAMNKKGKTVSTALLASPNYLAAIGYGYYYTVDGQIALHPHTAKKGGRAKKGAAATTSSSSVFGLGALGVVPSSATTPANAAATADEDEGVVVVNTPKKALQVRVRAVRAAVRKAQSARIAKQMAAIVAKRRAAKAAQK